MFNKRTFLDVASGASLGGLIGLVMGLRKEENGSGFAMSSGHLRRIVGFGVLAAVGLGGGLWLRTHHTLERSPRAWVDAYTHASFSEDEARQLALFELGWDRPEWVQGEAAEQIASNAAQRQSLNQSSRFTDEQQGGGTLGCVDAVRQDAVDLNAELWRKRWEKEGGPYHAAIAEAAAGLTREEGILQLLEVAAEVSPACE